MPFVIAFSFCIGAMVGSFLNVCIFRIPEGESIVMPASHCRSCKKPLRWFDNVPIFSFLILKGRCRDCGTKISPQYVLIELTTAFLFVLFYATFGLTAKGVIYLVFSLALLTQSVIDARHQIIPDSITLPGIVLGLVLSAVFPGLHGEEKALGGLLHSFIGVLAGGGVLYVAGTVAEWILKKEAMGGGDVKLLAMIGALLGWQGVLWTLFFSSFIGAAVGLYLRFTKGQERIPFGPYLAFASFLYLFFGQAFFEWYFGFLGFSA